MKKWFACLAVAGLLFSAGVGVSHAEVGILLILMRMVVLVTSITIR